MKVEKDKGRRGVQDDSPQIPGARRCKGGANSSVAFCWERKGNVEERRCDVKQWFPNLTRNPPEKHLKLSKQLENRFTTAADNHDPHPLRVFFYLLIIE